MQKMGLQISGSRIRDARLKAGLTQAQLARAISSGERNIVRWEAGENQPRISSVAAIAEATGHDIDFFLTEADDDEEDDAPLSREDIDLYLSLHARVMNQTRREDKDSLRELLLRAL